MVPKGVQPKQWKKCHFVEERFRRSGCPFWSHQTITNECSSVICDAINNGMTIDQIWRKEYNCGKKLKGE